jgi:YHS domain-containing protein/thiol-disulfide isomerase/thioredoxin
MRTTLILSLLLTLGLARPALAEIPWQSDFKAAINTARTEQKLILLHFYADDCPPCVALEQGPFRDLAVEQAVAENFVAVRVHAKNEAKLAKYFQIERWPTDVILDGTGRIYSSKVSPQTSPAYLGMLGDAAVSAGMPSSAPAAAGLAGPLQGPKGNVADRAIPAQELPPETTWGQSVQYNAASPPDPAAQYNPSAAYGNQPETRYSANGANNDVNVGYNAPAAIPAAAPQGQINPLVGGAAPGNIASNAAANTANTANSGPSTASAQRPPLAIDGYCPVSLLEADTWVLGQRQWGAVHLGQLYLFASSDAQRKFLAQPEIYAPVLAGIDIVKLFDEKRVVSGKRQFGVFYPETGPRRIYLFCDEASAVRFERDPKRYVRYSEAVMEQARLESRTVR